MNFLDPTLIRTFETWITTYSLRVAVALIFLLIGWRVVKLIHRIIMASIRRMNVDLTLMTFMDSLINILLKMTLIILCASMMGVAFTSFVAVIGAASLAVGLSLQGSLSNFAGGVLILLMRPFKVGDFIEAQGQMGTVSEIRIFYTYLKMVDNRLVVIPNGILSNNFIINYTAHASRRFEIVFTLAPDTNVAKAKACALALLARDERIFTDPAPFVGITAQNASSLHFVVRAWCATDLYWDVYHALIETLKERFDEENIRSAGIEGLLLGANRQK